VTKIKIMRWAGNMARMGVLVVKPERRKTLGRPRLRWEDNIKIDLREVGWDHGLG
jgi:hypothetical protein